IDDDLPFYNLSSHTNTFFFKLNKGDMFKYSNSFTFNSVAGRAERRGILVEKVKEGIVEVIGNKLKDPRPFHFDEELIDK
ncbi:MAG: hypothetical protein K9L62_10705, partial [Vallitaleaceae bacterium]|nr:hypothetical protein [Vallitaleaceae bacterium]